MRKSNAIDYAIDGQSGAGNYQKIKLSSYSNIDEDQQWIEIDRGGGYYSYQKLNTSHCLDGRNGATLRQQIHLWDCNSNNYNQHWLKEQQSDGSYRLIKRNNSDYALDGGNGGIEGRNIQLWTTTATSANLNWVFETVGFTGSSARVVQDNDGVLSTFAKKETLHIYPNPTSGDFTIELPSIEVAAKTMIRIVDLTGRMVFEQNDLQSSEKIILSQYFISGIYFVQWLDKDGNILQAEKLIKE